MAELVADARSAGIGIMFVPAEDDDVHALDFYRSIGGSASKVTIFEVEA